jgi:dienelactone hydrolase
MLVALAAVAALGASVLPAGAAPGTATREAEPIDTWELTHGIDCVGDRFNPTRPDGTKDPALDPEPGSADWIARDDERLACAQQRDSDRRWHPVTPTTSARYGEDWYRQPVRFDERRFRYDYFPLGTGIGGVPAMEVYRPCSARSCLNMEPGLERIEGPYPVVIIHHGGVAQMTHHRYNAQVFAEAGYLAITVNGIHPVTGAPNFQSDTNAGQVLDWLASEESGVIGRDADLDRVVLAGHSQGAQASITYQGDPRVHALLLWDACSASCGTAASFVDGIAAENTSQPIMYQRTDGAFSRPQNQARTDFPENRDRGLEGYLGHVERGLDVYHVTFRATTHVDWNGYGTGSLAGNRLAELVINYYSLAWLDRHAKGRLALDDDGAVVTQHGRTEAEERAYRQAVAQDAYDRLTAMRFDDSADRHNISMGFYDPVQHATSGDVLFGGNVPYRIEGLFVTDRMSQEWRSFCSVSVPDYVNGSDGSPGSPVAARADSGADGDLRLTGCPEV